MLLVDVGDASYIPAVHLNELAAAVLIYITSLSKSLQKSDPDSGPVLEFSR
uniref:Uncharacterized protein n=1 Tax=Anguilla anguilla TaxID=7936 RepID=A0A0E9TX95_ANGAN